MKPPEDLPAVLAALGDSLARRMGLDPSRFWAWLYRREPAPEWVRDQLVKMFDPLVGPDDFLCDEPLPSPQDGATIATDVQVQSPQKIRGARPTRHPWAKQLREQGLSIAEWADARDVPYSTARSWIQKGSGGRAIPRRWAKEIGLPDAAWKHGIVEDPPPSK